MNIKGFNISRDLSLVNSILLKINPLSYLGGARRKIYVSALGLQGCGKTTLQNYLRNEKFKDATIGQINIKDRVFFVGINVIAITKGKDVSGSVEATKAYNEEEFNKSDICFYIFNTQRLISENDYCEEVVGRLNFLNKLNLKKEKDSITKIILVASHFEASNDDRITKKEVWDRIQKIADEGKLEQPIYASLINENHLKNIKKRLFNEI